MTLLKNLKLYLALLLGILAFACSSSSPSSSPSSSTSSAPPVMDDEAAVIETDYGRVKIGLYPDVAPKHVENFKKLVREGFYNGLAFHRVIPDDIIQGGDPTTRGDDRSRWGMGLPDQPKVPAEFSNRPFVRGTVGAARASDPNSASSQFFICVRPQPQWNGQYTVFGQVLEGINTVQVISNAPRDPATVNTGDIVQEKVVIRRVYLEKRDATKK